MPRPKPEGAIGAPAARGMGGSTGSSVRKTGSAARRTAKTIKDINRPMSKASKQLAADATAARNARMAAVTSKDWAYRTKARAKNDSAYMTYTDRDLNLRTNVDYKGPGAGYGYIPATTPSRTPVGYSTRATKQIRTTPNPSAPVSKSAAKKSAKSLKNFGRLKTGM